MFCHFSINKHDNLKGSRYLKHIPFGELVMHRLKHAVIKVAVPCWNKIILKNFRPDFRREIGDTPSFLGPAFHNGEQDGKADGRINTADVLSTSRGSLLNFGPLSPEFTVIIWQPFMRQMREIGEKRSVAFDNAYQESMNRFASNSRGRRVWSFDRTSLNVKIES